MARGPHPEDRSQFAEANWPMLRRATYEVSWLLARQYPHPSAVTAVGDRHQLHTRQRTAIGRAAATDGQIAQRHARRLSPELLPARSLTVDGFNVIISLEVALTSGLLVRGRDGLLRDLAGLRGSYHVLPQTRAAVELLLEALQRLRVGAVEVLLDAPVANSGRLQTLVQEVAAERRMNLRCELTKQVDQQLMQRPLVLSADGVVLDHAEAHVDVLGPLLLARGVSWVDLQHDAPLD